MTVWKVVGLFMLLFVLSAAPASASSPSVSAISKQLVCQCGCTLTVANCAHAECMSRDAMLRFITQEVDRGQSEEQIIQTFVAQYGEQVLAEPPKRGFNLVAWTLPFVAILAGAALIFFLLKRWVWQGGALAVDVATEDEEENRKYLLQVEKELKDFAGGGFR